MTEFKNILQKIIRDKIKCIFVSPHLDDAIFSAGNLIEFLAKQTNVSVVNVFTGKPELPYTLSSKQYLRQCGYQDAENLYNDRITEDLAVLEGYGIKPINLQFVDSLFRKKQTNSTTIALGKILPEIIHTYPTYRFHICKGQVSSRDQDLIKSLQKMLESIVYSDSNDKGCIVFCPLGIGKHVDHVLVRNTCQIAFDKTIYWEDYPYNISESTPASFIDRENLVCSEFTNTDFDKRESFRGYKTQYKAIFGDTEPTFKAEKYYYRRDL